MAPKLSIVVPFYKVEDYLEECLASLAAQTMTDLEVIMVDDGSPDGCTVIAKTYVHRDARFRLLQQQNQGLGPARNTGVLHASGEYLAFADSDDLVPCYAYERMIGSLEESGSDLVSGAAQVFNSERASRARFYGDAFHTTRTRTHISRDPELMHDRTAWNKVFRRAFWDAHAFAFPAGAYEDAPVTLAAHVRAGNVDVLRDVVYHYRQRETGEQSITQRRTEVSNLEDRIASIRSVSAFLSRSAPALKDRYDLTTLDKDLMIFINVVEEGDAEYRTRLCALVDQYLQGVNPKLLGRLTSIKRLKYHLAREHRADDLVTVQEYERTGLPAEPAQARGLLRRRWYAGHPFKGDPQRAIPDPVYDMTDELRLYAQIDEVTWAGDVLRLTGHAYVPGLDMALTDHIEVWLQHTKTRRKRRLPVRRESRPEVTANSEQPTACYDGSGFVIDIDPAQLRSVPGWKSADWLLHAGVRVGAGRRRLRLDGPVARCGAAAQWSPYRDLFGGVSVQVVQPGSEGVAVRFRTVKALVTGVRQDGKGLEVTGWTTARTTGDDTVLLSCRERGTTSAFPVHYASADGERVPFRFRLPFADLVTAKPEHPAESGPTRLHWDPWLRARGKKVRIAVPEDFAESVQVSSGRGILLTRTRYGNLTLAEAAPHLVVTAVGWDGGRMAISGEYAGDPRTGDLPARLVLRRRRTGAQQTFPLTWEGGCFDLRLDLGAISTLAGTLPLASGTWDLLADDGAGTGIGVIPTRSCLAALPPGRDSAAHHYRVWPARGGEGLQLEARVARPDDERGPYAQRLLRERDYPAFLRRPQRDLVVFESYFGWQYSCNPKALYEEIRRRGTGHELIWVKGGQHFQPPDGAHAVQRHSREYYEVTAAARLVVNNVAQPTCYRKRPGQIYVQTWHGTPVKSVGFDMNWSRMERRDQRMRELTDDVGRWDLLLSQNPFSTGVLRSAFRYDGEILESGYPRNDLAYRPDHRQVRARVHRRLGLPAGKRVVLYTPTWRDHLQTSRHGLGRHHLAIDLDRAAAALDEDTVLLVRRHHLLNAPTSPGHEAFVVDVTGYPDITELYLAADALVTDYSSAMCDFAGFGKPILLFTPDLEAYRDEIRGFTFDLTANPPGPILRTSDELIEALSDLDGVADESADLRTDFARTFCPFDDGEAAARVVDRLLMY